VCGGRRRPSLRRHLTSCLRCSPPPPSSLALPPLPPAGASGLAPAGGRGPALRAFGSLLGGGSRGAGSAAASAAASQPPQPAAAASRAFATAAERGGAGPTRRADLFQKRRPMQYEYRWVVTVTGGRMLARRRLNGHKNNQWTVAK